MRVSSLEGVWVANVSALVRVEEAGMSPRWCQHPLHSRIQNSVRHPE